MGLLFEQLGGFGKFRIGLRDDFEEVSGGFFEVKSSTSEVSVDFSRNFLRGIGPVGNIPLFDPFKDLVELILFDEESVVLRGNRIGCFYKVERDIVRGF